ncbi:unknown [Eggerthella sp. CAG:209]|nr:unknown [Eggerthella sp. CAG:209]
MICSSLSYREALPHDEESGAWDCIASRRGLIINERIE